MDSVKNGGNRTGLYIGLTVMAIIIIIISVLMYVYWDDIKKMWSDEDTPPGNTPHRGTTGGSTTPPPGGTTTGGSTTPPPGGTATGGSTTPPPPPPEQYNFMQRSSRKCLTMIDNMVSYSECDTSSANQKWIIDQSNSYIYSPVNSKCLAGDGNNVYPAICDSSKPKRQWDRDGNKIKHKDTNMCLAGNGNILRFRSCNTIDGTVDWINPPNTVHSMSPEPVNIGGTTTAPSGLSPGSSTLVTAAPVTPTPYATYILDGTQTIRINDNNNIDSTHFIANNNTVDSWGIPSGNNPKFIRINDRYLMSFKTRLRNRIFVSSVDAVPPTGTRVTKLEFIQ